MPVSRHALVSAPTTLCAGAVLLGCAGAVLLGCAGHATRTEPDWSDEQRCDGTGEEALPEPGCRMATATCELPAPPTADDGGRPHEPRPGVLRIEGDPMARLDAVLLERAMGADGPARVLAVSVGTDRIPRPVPDCRLDVRIQAIASAPGQPQPALVAQEFLVAAPAPFDDGPCAGATHFLAASWGGRGIALPLACPPLDATKAPTSCLAAELVPEQRVAWATRIYNAGHAAYAAADYALALERFLTLRALMPDSTAVLHNLMQTLDHLASRSCDYEEGVRWAWEALPTSDAPPRATTGCSPTPPLLGCLPGFVSASTPGPC